MIKLWSVLHHQLYHMKRVRETDKLLWFASNITLIYTSRHRLNFTIEDIRDPHTTKKTKKKTKIGQRTFNIIENHGVLVPMLPTHHPWSVNTSHQGVSTKSLVCMMKLGKNCSHR